jgi:hypothetical protein
VPQISFRSVALGAALFVAVPAYAGFSDLMKSAGDMLQGGSIPGLSGTSGSGLSDSQIDAGLKQALAVGAERAVALLGKSGGFLNDRTVRIPLPGALEKVAQTARSLGQGRYVDEFETTVNRAAEQAIPQTLDIVKQTVSNMSLQDARGILSGGDDAATNYLREKAGDSLRAAIRPIISQATDKAGATAAYKRLVESVSTGGLGSSLGSSLGGNLGGSLGGLLGKQVNLDLDDYVTDKALDGLFLKLAAEEKAIRTNPVARSTELLKQVFGH